MDLYGCFMLKIFKVGLIRTVQQWIAKTQNKKVLKFKQTKIRWEIKW